MEGSPAIALLGYGAALLTTCAAIPQIHRTWVNRSTENLSLAMLVTLTSGLACWTIYGVFIHAVPIIVANGISCVLNLSLIAMKLWFQKEEK